MKILIFVSLISAAIALPKPGVIQAPDQAQSIPPIRLQTPTLPDTENNDEGIVYQVKIVDSDLGQLKETIPEDGENEEPFEKIIPLNNEVLSDIKSRILERLGNKINNLKSNNDEPEFSEVRDQVQVEDGPIFSEVAKDDNIITGFIPQKALDSDVVVVKEPEVSEFDDQIQVEDSEVVVVKEPENPQFNEQVQVEESDVSVVQEPEGSELNDQVQIEDSPISGIAQGDNIVSHYIQENSEHLNNLRDQILNALVNKFNTIRFNNDVNENVEPVVPEFHDQVHVVDSPINDNGNNIVSDFDAENVNVVDGPVLISNHILNHGVETVHVVNNPLFDMFQTPQVQQQIIIVGSPLEIVEAVHKIIEHVQVVQTNDPPRIYKFPNPLLR